jgi:hypothetical protein
MDKMGKEGDRGQEEGARGEGRGLRSGRASAPMIVKSEIRISKFETNPKSQIPKISNRKLKTEN